MSNAALSDGQFAEHLNRSDTGGASLNFKDRTEVSGKGFMTAFSGAEKTLPLPAKEEDITSFKEKNKPAVEGNAAAVHGAWKYRRGHHLKEGGDVLFHTADLGKNDSDPRYRPGALDMAGGKGSFTRNQYANKDWKKVGGTLNGKPVNYESVLRTINENRTNRMRGE